MRTKPSAWYDKENDAVLHGIKVFVYDHWHDAAEDGKVLLFHTEAEMEVKRREVRKWTAR